MQIEEFSDALEIKIKEWFGQQAKNAPTDEARILLERLRSYILRGGKRSRPKLFFETYKAYGGKTGKDLLDLALALELLHQYLMIHDDIIDDDTVRYNGPNIVGAYEQDGLNAEQNIPQAMGLLAGDLLQSFANQLINTSGVSSDKKVLLSELFHEANIAVAYGQQLDAFNVKGAISSFTDKRLIKIHKLKTSQYAMRLPMLWAAVLLDSSKSEQAKIQRFATAFGILFQLVDDYSDYFVNGSVANKNDKFKDFRQGKITYPIHVGFQQSSTADVKFLKEYFGDKNLTGSVQDKVATILERSGAKDKSREFIEKYFGETYAALDQLDIKGDSKRILTAMVDKYRV